MRYEELDKAVKTLELLGYESREDIKQKYLTLSKKFHPDMSGGSKEKFQEINKAYKILTDYVDNFKFRFTKEEFENQFPLSGDEGKKWSLW